MKINKNEVLNKIEKPIVITENAIKVIVYHQIATLLEEGDGDAKYPIFNDWFIKWEEPDADNYSDNIWIMKIALYNGERFINCFHPFKHCMTYAELAKGDVDCIELTTEEIVDTIYKNEED